MKIQAPSTIRKKIALTFGAVLVLLSCATAFAYHFQVWPFHAPQDPSSINMNPATPDQKMAGETTKQASLKGSASKQTTSGSDQPPAPTPQPGSSKSNVEVTITAANQTSNTLQVRALISSVVNEGTCTLILTNSSGKTVTHTASVQPLSSTSTCKGFDVPNAELSPGDWTITLNYDSNTMTGSTTKNITIK